MAQRQMTYLTVAEVAEQLRVSRMTVYRLVHDGKLASVRVGKSYRITPGAVDDMLAQSMPEVG